MVKMSNLPFELFNLSKELKAASVLESGWPPPASRLPVDAKTSVSKHSQHEHEVPSSTPATFHQNRSNDKSFFEKIRLNIQRGRDITSSNDEGTQAMTPKNILTEMFHDLVGSCGTWNSIDTTGNHEKRQNSIPFAQLKRLERIYDSNRMRELVQHDTDALSIETPHGHILFDFSKQLINQDIHRQWMELVRSSQLDKYIHKVFHKSGEYHHVDYKEARKEQLKNEYPNRDHWSYRAATSKNDTSHVISSTNSRSPRYDNDSNVSIVKDKRNRLLTMAKAVHFRTPLKCFELDGVDIAFNFQRDSDIIRQTCLLFHSPKNVTNSIDNPSIHTVFVVCSHKMIKLYRLLESLFKSYISHSISIVYAAFDEIKPFLAKYEHETDAIPILQQRTDSSVQTALLDHLRSASLILIFMKHLDEKYVFGFLRWYTEMGQFSNLFIEHLWLVTSDYQRAQIVFDMPKKNFFPWPTESTDVDLMSIVISSILILPLALTIDYENYIMFVRGLSMVDEHCQQISMDRNVCIQMALLRIWSIICQRKTIALVTCDDELQHFGEFAQMMLTEYGYEHEREPIATYMSIHGMSQAKNLLRQENELAFDLIAVRRFETESSISDLSNPAVSEILTISAQLYGMEKSRESVSQPYTLILFDRLTPLTLGVLVGVYQMAIFFENIIRQSEIQSNLNSVSPIVLSSEQ